MCIYTRYIMWRLCSDGDCAHASISDESATDTNAISHNKTNTHNANHKCMNKHNL